MTSRPLRHCSTSYHPTSVLHHLLCLGQDTCPVSGSQRHLGGIQRQTFITGSRGVLLQQRVTPADACLPVSAAGWHGVQTREVGEGLTDVTTGAHYSSEQAACLLDRTRVHPAGARRLSGLSAVFGWCRSAPSLHKGAGWGAELVRSGETGGRVRWSVMSDGILTPVSSCLFFLSSVRL